MFGNLAQGGWSFDNGKKLQAMAWRVRGRNPAIANAMAHGRPHAWPARLVAARSCRYKHMQIICADAASRTPTAFPAGTPAAFTQEISMSAHLQDKVAVVTGDSSGIGLASAKRLAAAGAAVFVTGRRQAELDAAVLDIGANAIGVRADVSKVADLDRLYEEVRLRKGRLDILVANAGVQIKEPLGSITESSSAPARC